VLADLRCVRLHAPRSLISVAATAGTLLLVACSLGGRGYAAGANCFVSSSPAAHFGADSRQRGEQSWLLLYQRERSAAFVERRFGEPDSWPVQVVRTAGDSLVLSWSTGVGGGQHRVVQRDRALQGRGSSWSDELTRLPDGTLSAATDQWDLSAQSEPCPTWVLENALPSASSELMLRATAIVDSAWSAAARADWNGVRTLTRENAVVAWLRTKSEVSPAMLSVDPGNITPLGGYFLDGYRRQLHFVFEIPWVSCPLPVYAGEPTTVYATLDEAGDQWRIVDLWTDIC